MKEMLKNYQNTNGIEEFTMCNPLSDDCACPEIVINRNRNEVIITDDFNSSVMMTLDQFESLKYYFTKE